MTTYDTSGEVYQTWVLLRRAAYAVVKVRERELAQYGISSVEAAVLVVIQDMQGKATTALISRQILREPHTVSLLLARMQKKGLVKKTPDRSRKNVIRIALTEKGLETYHLGLKLESVRPIVESLSEKEGRQLRSLLQKVLEKALEELKQEKKSSFASTGA